MELPRVVRRGGKKEIHAVSSKQEKAFFNQILNTRFKNVIYTFQNGNALLLCTVYCMVNGKRRVERPVYKFCSLVFSRLMHKKLYTRNVSIHTLLLLEMA
jgi:hypothetical protein